MREIAQRRQAVTPLVSILKCESVDQTMDEARAAYIAVKARQVPPSSVAFAPVDMAGVPAALAASDAAVDGRNLFYLHGGGYMSGGSDASRAEVGRLAVALRARAYVPDYRLAPEHPYTAPLDDVLAVYRWLLGQGVPAASTVFVGGSAGGVMEVSIMVHARHAGLPLPARGLAISPWLNLEHTGISIRTRDGFDPVMTRGTFNLQARAFLCDTLPGDPDASPRGTAPRHHVR